jgi:K+/H+ antiporter YhaU regulatory subunit KhtT
MPALLAWIPSPTSNVQTLSITVLGIRRTATNAVEYVDHPSPDEVIRLGDQFVLHGPMASLANLRNGRR